jgi:SAM-dependent methyltransferase
VLNRGLRRTLARLRGSPGVRYISTRAELDGVIEHARQQSLISDDHLRRALASFHFVADRALPDDPFSAEYHHAQMCLYAEIAGRDGYSVANEASVFDLESAKHVPFPYATRSAATVGDQLIAQGFLIRTMALPPGARILEFGPGWGNTTVHLAQMGYHVTAVDVEQAFLDLIRYRTRELPEQVLLVRSDMLEYSAEEKFDAVVFFESFHHCADHLRLLARLDQLTTADGIVVFAAEPIGDFPDPWGVRLDGMSVWSIRRHGWLELGFDIRYFTEALARFGWTATRHRLEGCALADVIVTRKASTG